MESKSGFSVTAGDAEGLAGFVLKMSKMSSDEKRKWAQLKDLVIAWYFDHD